MGDERAETYLRLLAEREVRRVMAPPLGHADLPGSPGPRGRADFNMSTSDIAASAQWKIQRAGRILVAAGALDAEFVDRLRSEIEAAFTVRSRTQLSRPGVLRRLLDPAEAIRLPDAPRPPATARPMRVTPLGRGLRVAYDRAPSDLHFMSLVSTPAGAAITLVIRMHWPPDGSSADLEVNGADYGHLPYERLWLADDRGQAYPIGFDGEGGTATWQGLIRLSCAPPPDAGWLDLIADGTTRLIRLDLRAGNAQGQARAAVEPTRPAAQVERLLIAEAEDILASAWDIRGPNADSFLGEISTALTEAGLIEADSAIPGQLAALCQRLGVAGHGITAPPAARIPAPWASVVAQHRNRYLTRQRREVFAPLAAVLPDLEGTRFALAGLSSAAGESYLHVVASGLPQQAERFTTGWYPGFSWWLRDDAGDWHVATMVAPRDRAAGDAEFRLRLTPPLADAPDTIEVLVTGACARVRATVPVRGTPAIPDT